MAQPQRKCAVMGTPKISPRVPDGPPPILAARRRATSRPTGNQVGVGWPWIVLARGWSLDPLRTAHGQDRGSTVVGQPRAGCIHSSPWCRGRSGSPGSASRTLLDRPWPATYASCELAFLWPDHATSSHTRTLRYGTNLARLAQVARTWTPSSMRSRAACVGPEQRRSAQALG